MSDQPKSSSEIAAEIAAMENELAAARTELKAVEERAKELRAKIEELDGIGWSRSGGGIIESMKRDHARAKHRETLQAGRAVRVTYRYSDKPEILAFQRRTPKQIYLLTEHRTIHFPIDGGDSSWSGKIHPDDLALILAGRADELPLVADADSRGGGE